MTAKIAAALTTAQKSLKGVHKDSRNAHHKYDYANSESIYQECRHALFDHGLAVIPQGGAIDHEAGVLRRAYLLVHESGERVEMSQDWPIVPGNGRPMDKAAASAYTASLAYFLRDLLLLPRVEKGVDLDDDERDAPLSSSAGRSEERRSGSNGETRGRAAANPSAPEDPESGGDLQEQVKAALKARGVTTQRKAKEWVSGVIGVELLPQLLSDDEARRVLAALGGE